MESKDKEEKSAAEILWDHSIDIKSMGDTFNFQLLHAMERYKDQAVESFRSRVITELEGMKIHTLNDNYHPDNNILRKAIERVEKLK